MTTLTFRTVDILYIHILGGGGGCGGGGCGGHGSDIRMAAAAAVLLPLCVPQGGDMISY